MLIVLAARAEPEKRTADLRYGRLGASTLFGLGLWSRSMQGFGA